MKRLLVVLAVVALLATAVAEPVAATGRARHGDFDLELYLTPCSETDPESPFLVWAGTIEFGHRNLGIAYFAAAEYVELDGGWGYFEEDVTLFRLPPGELTEQKLIAAACKPHREVLRAADAGLNTPWGTAFAAGHTTWARGYGHRYVGGEFFWNGYYTSEAGDTFSGTLWLVPGNII